MAARMRAVGLSVTSLAVVILLAVPRIGAQTASPPVPSADQQEQFLKDARILRTRGAGKGVTNTLRATLTDGTLTHDASIQTVDEYRQVFQSKQGVEFNFRDSWRYNVAAYRLNRVLQLGHVPVTIERLYNGKPGAFTWWVDDVLMDEAERLKTKPAVPDTEEWNRQMWHVRIFDQPIYNVDRNLGNLLIDKSWSVWMIDHSRAFRLADSLRSPHDLTHIEKGALERLKSLDRASLDAAVGKYLSPDEKQRLLARRDAIVAHFAKLGPGAVY